jgi:hypothetical protein
VKTTVHGQTEMTHDLMRARSEANLPTIYEADPVSVHDFDTSPVVRYRQHGVEHVVTEPEPLSSQSDCISRGFIPLFI